MTGRRNRQSGISQKLQKYGLSAVVLGSFAAYAIHEHATNPDFFSANGSAQPTLAQAASVPTIQPTDIVVTALPADPPTTLPTDQPTDIPTDQPAATLAPEPTAEPTLEPTAVPTKVPAKVANGLREGTFTGPTVDAYYGLVQVQASIKGGKIVDVQFLDYPHDRRTSQRINNIAMPYLIQEAIQVQNARVDIISGATLTSEAFQESLNGALSQARG